MIDPPSQTGIVNAALARLGSIERIQSIEAGSSVARNARAVWDNVLRDLLTSYPWNFALRRVSLNARNPAPAFGFARAFTLPEDCLRWLPPNEDDADDSYFVGVEEDGAVLTDAEAPLLVRYISSAPLNDWSRWPAHFVQAMEFRMAEAMAEPVTGSESRANRMADAADRAERRARRIDALATGNRNRVSVTNRSNWVSARQRPYNPLGTR